MLTEELKKRVILQGHPGWNGALAALLSRLVGQDLYKAGKALTDMGDLDQHVNTVLKVREQPTGDRKRQNKRRGLSVVLKDKCGKTCVDLEFLRAKIDRKPNCVLRIF